MNNDIKQILINHFNLYPQSQITDMVKLLYQNEFGGGHMISDSSQSLNYLKSEINSLNFKNEKIYEYIGNNLCRFNLNAVKSLNLELNTLNQMFVYTANNVKGDIKIFEEKLKILRELCTEFSFSLDEFDNYLTEYKAKGYPAVSHSEIYRKNYFPAYRVIDFKFIKYLDLFLKIDELLKKYSTVIIAIDGKCASGKTTLSKILSFIYDCNVFHMDDFFLTSELKTPERLAEIGGNVDYLRFNKEILSKIKLNIPFKYQVYNCSKQILDNFVEITPKKLNIVEGVYSMHPTLINNYDLKILLTVDNNTQSERILKRNGEVMHKKFINEWIPLENKYLETLKYKDMLIF